MKHPTFLTIRPDIYSIDICGTSPNLYYVHSGTQPVAVLGNIRVLDYENYLTGTGSSTLFGDRISIRAEIYQYQWGLFRADRDNYTLSITEETWNEALNLMRTKQGRIYLPIASGKKSGIQRLLQHHQQQSRPIRLRAVEVMSNCLERSEHGVKGRSRCWADIRQSRLQTARILTFYSVESTFLWQAPAH